MYDQNQQETTSSQIQCHGKLDIRLALCLESSNSKVVFRLLLASMASTVARIMMSWDKRLKALEEVFLDVASETLWTISRTT